jgi:hypothetical protein
MMCGRDEEPQPSVVAIMCVEKSLWLVQAIGLWTPVIDSKKQALKGPKKIFNDV